MAGAGNQQRGVCPFPWNLGSGDSGTSPLLGLWEERGYLAGGCCSAGQPLMHSYKEWLIELVGSPKSYSLCWFVNPVSSSSLSLAAESL